ncbi:MAG: ThuA domain-containing protein [Opitutaceae bacterium]
MKTRRMFHRVLLTALLLAPLALRAAEGAPKRVLVVTVTTGFRHSCIPVSETVLARLAKDDGRFTVDFVRQPEGMPRPPARPRPGPAGESDPAHQAAMRKFAADEKAFNDTWNPRIEAALRALSPENLRNYDAVLFASTTGDLPLPDKQGFVDWVAGGKAYIGVHAATDTCHGFRPVIDMLGGEFRTHGPQVPVEVLNDDPAHAAAAPPRGISRSRGAGRSRKVASSTPRSATARICGIRNSPTKPAGRTPPRTPASSSATLSAASFGPSASRRVKRRRSRGDASAYFRNSRPTRSRTASGGAFGVSEGW